jgi:serine/threonine protein kinase
MHELAKINHPNIIGYYGYHDNQTGVYFFLELCTNGNLK